MAIVNISTVSDADFNRAFAYKVQSDPNDASSLIPFDLTGSTLVMGVRKNAEDKDEVLLLTSDVQDGGINIFDAEHGLFYVTIKQTFLLNLVPGIYVHSLVRLMRYRDQDFRYRIWSGTLTHVIGPSR